MRTRQIQYLRPEEITAEIARVPIAYIPFGLIEWHGPHLPMGMDALHAEYVARAAAEQTGGLVMPTVYFGTDRLLSAGLLRDLGFAEPPPAIVGMDYPANSLPSMYVNEEVFGLFVREQYRVTAAMGFKTIVALTGHAAPAQGESLRRNADFFNTDPANSARVIATLPFTSDDPAMPGFGHASKVETALMQAIAPDAVRIDALPPLPEPLKNIAHAIVDYLTFDGQPTPDHAVHDIDDPRHASAALGHEVLKREVAYVVRVVNEHTR
jgi:creatinine amidohydrolase